MATIQHNLICVIAFLNELKEKNLVNHMYDEHKISIYQIDEKLDSLRKVLKRYEKMSDAVNKFQIKKRGY